MVLQIILGFAVGVFIGVVNYHSGKRHGYDMATANFLGSTEDAFNKGYHNGYHNGVAAGSKISLTLENPNKKKAKKTTKKK